MPNFKQMPMAPSQIVMFPVSVEDSLPADCDVRLLGEAMEALDWRAFEASYAQTGCPAYPPKVMCKILVYGYAKGIRSSRALEEAAKHDRPPVGGLAGGLQPDHCAIARFRKEHASQLKEIYRATVRLCARGGLVLLNVTATDGSKIPARASRRSLYDAKRLAREMEQTDRILAEAEAADREEDALYGETSADSLPGDLADAKRRKEKLARIAARLEESGRKSVAATEADCRVMKTSQGLRPAYNVQLTVDAEHGVVVAAELSQQETDNPPAGGLAGQLEQVAENLGCRPDVAVADTGYSDEGTFQWLEQTKQGALLPPKEQPQKARSNDLFSSKCFLADEGEDALICPAGRRLTFRRVVKCSSGKYRVYTAQNCRDCSFYVQYVPVKGKRGRSVQISVVEGQKEQMRQKLKSAAGKALWRLRQETVERVLGNVKANLRFGRFGLAGKGGAGGELRLVCTAHNLLLYLRTAACASRAIGRLAERSGTLARAGKQISSAFHHCLRHFSPASAQNSKHFCNGLQAAALQSTFWASAAADVFCYSLLALQREFSPRGRSCCRESD
jgi:transposase